MTDDTPTERFDAAGDTPPERFDAAAGDAPTERLTAADAASMDAAALDPEVQEERKSRKTMIILGSIGAALLIILIILLILLLVRPGASVAPTGSPSPSPTTSASASPTPTRTATPSATPTPTPTPTPTATVAPPPPSNDVEIDSFDATSEVDCSAQTQNPEYIEFSWSSTNGLVAYFAVGAVDNAETNGMGWTLPPSGSTSDFPSGYFPYEFQCGNQSQTFTITIVGSNGSRESAQVTVTNVGDTF